MTPEKKKVAEIELYHTLTLIFSQPQQVVNKYFSHKPHWWSCVGWPKQSHSIHWQDIILQVFTMVCLIFHTVIKINRKKWRITTKLHFENLSNFLKKQTYAHARIPPPPPSSPPVNTTSDTLSSTLYLEGQTRYFTVLDRHTNYTKNKMDSKFIKSRQCSLGRSRCIYWN